MQFVDATRTTYFPMRGVVLLLLSVFCCCGVRANEIERNNAIFNLIHDVALLCYEKQDISRDYIKIINILRDKNAEDFLKALRKARQETKCFAKCFLTRINYIREDGSLNKKVFILTYDRIITSAQFMMNQKLGHVMDEYSKNCLYKDYSDKDEECSGAWRYVLCSAEQLQPVIQGTIDYVRRKNM